MKDIKTELDNTIEILRGKLLDIQEVAFYHKILWRCTVCGIEIDANKFVDFDVYKKTIDDHTKSCIMKHNEEQRKKFEEETRGFTAEQKLQLLEKKIMEMKP